MYETDKKSLITQKQRKSLKKDKLRYNEYYDTQHIYDNLYKQSKGGSNFKHLYGLISSNENILLAYRNIKSNRGSKTPGINGRNIKYIEKLPTEEFLRYIKARLNNYQPQKIKRVEIPKFNGKTRPLGIPCIEDRIIQQCIKQILEPICEAKFYHNSYGFRPNRSTKHAIAYTYKKINLEHCYYTVDMDIKGFFDNVNHSKLLKQLWTIGIHDKKVLSIISAMLKAEIQGCKISNKGIPQGGILSPLLANVVLNELDWWLSTQWETFPTRQKSWNTTGNKYRHLRLSRLKEFYVVRYADDFKIVCKEYRTAKRIYKATEQWLKERLNLDISPDKSKIINIKKQATEFLGFSIKACKKGRKYVIQSHMCDTAIKKATKTLKDQVVLIQHGKGGLQVYILNRLIAGLHNYYNIASHVSTDFHNIHYNLIPSLRIRLKELISKTGNKSKEYLENYEHPNYKPLYVCGQAVFPIEYIQTKYPKVFNQNVTNYTKTGRKMIHDTLGFVNKDILHYISQNPIINHSTEYNDNRLSLYCAQKGKCAISHLPLEIDMELHHVIPRHVSGDDSYKNLILVKYEIHKLIHLTDKLLIKFYISKLHLKQDVINKINIFRLKIGNDLILTD